MERRSFWRRGVHNATFNVRGASVEIAHLCTHLCATERKPPIDRRLRERPAAPFARGAAADWGGRTERITSFQLISSQVEVRALFSSDRFGGRTRSSFISRSCCEATCEDPRRLLDAAASADASRPCNVRSKAFAKEIQWCYRPQHGLSEPSPAAHHGVARASVSARRRMTRLISSAVTSTSPVPVSLGLIEIESFLQWSNAISTGSTVPAEERRRKWTAAFRTSASQCTQRAQPNKSAQKSAAYEWSGGSILFR